MGARMWSVLAVAGLLIGVVTGPVAAAKPGTSDVSSTSTTESESVTVPSSMAALGDSITRGFNACGLFFDCTGRSWSTGSSRDKVSSHFERLRSLDATMSEAHNDARTGAKVKELATQAQTAAGRGVGYVTVLIGANDACTSSVDTMTSVENFATAFDAGMDALEAAAVRPKVFVASIPDLYRLWSVGKDSTSARNAWSTYGICQSMLANPTSTDPLDEARRQEVLKRVNDFNLAMDSRCATSTLDCRWDGGKVFSYQFELGHLSTWDYFHPNESGQAVLAEETWKVGFTWAAATTGGGGGTKGGGKK